MYSVCTPTHSTLLVSVFGNTLFGSPKSSCHVACRLKRECEREGGGGSEREREGGSEGRSEGEREGVREGVRDGVRDGESEGGAEGVSEGVIEGE